MAAATVNVWTMYISINKAIGLSFSENVMKSVGSAVISNIVQNVGFMAIVHSVRQSLSNYADIKELFEKYRKR